MQGLNIYTSFQPKLSECCHEVMVNNVRDCVMLMEKVVIFKKKEVIIFVAVSCKLLAITVNRIFVVKHYRGQRQK